MSMFLCGQSYFGPQTCANSSQTGLPKQFESWAPRGGQLLRLPSDKQEMTTPLDLQHRYTQTTAAARFWKSSERKLYISSKLSSLRLTETSENALPHVVATRNVPMDADRLTKLRPDDLSFVNFVARSRNAPMAVDRLTEPLEDALPRNKHHRNVLMSLPGQSRFLKDASLVTTPDLKAPPPTPNLKVPPLTPNLKVPPPTSNIKVPSPTPNLAVPPPTPNLVAPPPTPNLEVPRPTSNFSVPPPTPNFEVPGPRTPNLVVPPPTPNLVAPPPTPNLEVPSPTPNLEVPSPTPNVKIPPLIPHLKVPLEPSRSNKETIHLPRCAQLVEQSLIGRRGVSQNAIVAEAGVHEPTLVCILTLLQPADDKMSKINSSKPAYSQAFMTPALPATKRSPSANKRRHRYSLSKGSLEFPVYR